MKNLKKLKTAGFLFPKIIIIDYCFFRNWTEKEVWV